MRTKIQVLGDFGLFAESGFSSVCNTNRSRRRLNAYTNLLSPHLADHYADVLPDKDFLTNRLFWVESALVNLGVTKWFCGRHVYR